MTFRPERSLTILGIPGSLRHGSFNRALLEAGEELTPPGTTLTVYDHLEEVPLFNQDFEDVAPGGVTRLRNAIRQADALLIATPEYNQSVPGVLKNAIDWLSRSDPTDGIAGKPVAVIGATTGPWGTRLAQTQLRHILVSCQALVLSNPALYVRNARTVFDQSGLLIDEETKSLLRNVVRALADWTRLMSPSAQIEGPTRTD